MKLDFSILLPTNFDSFQLANIQASSLLQKEILKQKSLCLLSNFQIDSDRLALSRVSL